jgi:hypothetical protein
MIRANFPLFFLLLLGVGKRVCAFVGVVTSRTRHSPQTSFLSLLSQQAATVLELDNNYHGSFDLIDECAASGRPTSELYDAVRYIDKNALRLYPDESAKLQLWGRAHGSWKLTLATGGGRSTTFKPVPIFAFAMIDDMCFGNGVGLNSDTIFLSLLGPHYFNAKRRQMGIGIENVYLFSNEVTQYVPGFVAEGMNLGKTPNDFAGWKSRMPAFTMIGASDRSLIARGGSGGIAIWTKLEKDIRPTAYGMKNINNS